MLKPLHLSRTELATYVARQLTIFYPDGLDTDAPTVLAAHMDAALAPSEFQSRRVFVPASLPWELLYNLKCCVGKSVLPG